MSRYSEDISRILTNVKVFIFGENNSRLEIAIEYFYKLNHERRIVIIVSTIATTIALILFIIIFYFLGLYFLQNDLNRAYSNTLALNNMKPSYMAVQDKFLLLVNNLKSENLNISISSMLEAKAKELGIQASGFPDRPIVSQLPNQSPFAGQFKKISIDFKLSNVSIKKIMEYIKTVEDLPNKFVVSKLNIKSLSEAKLYFDVAITVDGVIPSEKQEL
ncbi:hypothetical protein [Fluviispira multicolorata]|uniref:Uncharacterized protein n=1 Tax=Fluviispira multicolorata TaxID=2654512 RepID=A0A833JAQ9_9BACT|nr:hypothetical protein [Fluviispira multicolorata]KAB8027405.1 hypothetical protein GCL57_14510 [Fluviispira multicolorata]